MPDKQAIIKFFFMNIFNKFIEFTSKEYLEFKDITEEVKKVIKESKIKEGQVLVYSMHTTVAVCVNEKEKGFFEDFKECITNIAPKDKYYRHNDLNIRTENLVCQSGVSDCLNGHSHCSHLLIRNSETIPIMESKPVLGTWQRIFTLELDCSRPRKIMIQVIGN